MMVTNGKMMALIGPDVVQPGSVMYQKRRSQRMAVERWRPRARRRSVAKRILLEIRGLNAKSRSHCSSCRSVDSCAVHQELCEHVLLFHIVPYFLFSHCIFSHFLPYMLSSFLISIFECRKILNSNEYLIAAIGVDMSENGPFHLGVENECPGDG